MLNKSKKKLIVHQFLQSPSLNLFILSNRISDMIQVNQNVIYEYLDSITEQKAFGRVLKRDVLKDIENEYIDVTNNKINPNNNIIDRSTGMSTIFQKNPENSSNFTTVSIKEPLESKRYKQSSLNFQSGIEKRMQIIDNFTLSQKNRKVTDESNNFIPECASISDFRKSDNFIDFSKYKKFIINGVDDELIGDFLIVYEFVCTFRKEILINSKKEQGKQKNDIEIRIENNSNKNDSEKIMNNSEIVGKVVENLQRPNLSELQKNDFHIFKIISNIPPFLTISSFLRICEKNFKSVLIGIFDLLSQERKKEKVLLFRGCVERAIEIYYNKNQDNNSNSKSNEESISDEHTSKTNSSSYEDKNIDFLLSHKRIQWFYTTPNNSNILQFIMSFFIDIQRVMDIQIPRDLNFMEISNILKDTTIEKKNKGKNKSNGQKDKIKSKSNKERNVSIDKTNLEENENIDQTSKTENNLKISNLFVKIKLLKFLIDVYSESNHLKMIIRDWNKEMEEKKNQIRNEIKFIRNEIKNIRIYYNKFDEDINTNKEDHQLNQYNTENENKSNKLNAKLNHLFDIHRKLTCLLFLNRLGAEIGELKNHVFIFIDKKLLFYNKNDTNNFFQVDHINLLYKKVDDSEIKENLKMCLEVDAIC